MIHETNIWQRSFGTEPNHNITRLTASLESFRSKVVLLTSKIAESLPHLTIHDITHLDALWEVADTIVGDDFPLNPLEAYVFGGAVLLHDAALCFEAHAGGQQGLRNTVEWKDAHARLSSLTDNARDIYSEADFEALRCLHASQAARLACGPWQAQSNDPGYLIEDSELRDSYGRLVGEIAASHHWDIKAVVEKFSSPRPAASFLHRDWIVDPLKIACMLRVADAGHIDGARAPTFLLNLLEMNSVSRSHWVAQNRLGRIMVDPNDPTQLIVASTRPFPENEAAAWWVAFDAISLFDKELRDCNEVLRNTGNESRPQFARKRVAGAGNVKELTKYVETLDWEPTDTKVHVSDVASLIEKLGGAELYSVRDKLEIALRELVQNSSDAIAARRAFTGESIEDRITVRLTRNPRTGRFVLQIDDDGIGMSEKTLTGDLMDFGKSFWRSARASQEFPGIQASGLSPAGRFGIGFFSVFMIADSVKIFSRRFDKGIDSVRCLSFTNGLSLRPTLSKQIPEGFGMNVSTRVEVEFENRHLPNPNDIHIHANIQGYEGFRVNFYDYIAALVSGIGARVFVEWDGPATQVHSGFPPQTNGREEWLKTLSYVSSGANTKAQQIIAAHTSRLREIRDGDRIYGLAAINTGASGGCNFVSAKAVGGLVPLHDRHDGSYIGLIDHYPRNAKREAGEKTAPVNAVRCWLEEQLELLQRENLDPIQSIMASYSLSEFDFDPIAIFRYLMVITAEGPSFWRLDQLDQLLDRGNRLGFRVSSFGSRLENYGHQSTISGLVTYCVINNGKFNDITMENNVPKNLNSLVGVVHRTLEEKGRSPTWMTTAGAYNGPFGRCDCLEVRI